jgi:hypothetical protein
VSSYSLLHLSLASSHPATIHSLPKLTDSVITVIKNPSSASGRTPIPPPPHHSQEAPPYLPPHPMKLLRSNATTKQVQNEFVVQQRKITEKRNSENNVSANDWTQQPAEKFALNDVEVMVSSSPPRLQILNLYDRTNSLAS